VSNVCDMYVVRGYLFGVRCCVVKSSLIVTGPGVELGVEVARRRRR